MNKQILQEDVQRFAESFELWEQLRGKTFLITGATGLIGSVMVKCLLELNQQKNLGIKVIAVVRSLEKAQKVFEEELSHIKFYQLGLAEIGVSSICEHVDYVVHLASPTASKFFVEHPVETMRTVIEGTTSVLEYSKGVGIKSMVYASSLEVYGSNDSDDWLDESFQGYVNPMEVRSSYNIGKRAAECLCHAYADEYQVPVKIARLTQTTGAGISIDDNRVIVQFVRSAVQGKDIILHTSGESARPYCYTTDAISAILYILLKGAGGEAYNVANDKTYISARNMAEYIKKEINPSIDVKFELNNDMGYAPVTRLRLDTGKIKSLGWVPKVNEKELYNRLFQSLKKL